MTLYEKLGARVQLVCTVLGKVRFMYTFLDAYRKCDTIAKRKEWLLQYITPPVIEETLQEGEELILWQLHFLGQLHRIGGESSWSDLAREILPTEQWYWEEGGILGYHTSIARVQREKVEEGVEYFPPSYIDISQGEYVSWGIEALEHMVEIYPFGGAADRLGLVEETTKEPLPAAKFSFLGKTLLRRLVEDLEARELLYYQKTGKKIQVPIFLMTSKEKNNHAHIVQMCERASWFGRGKEGWFLVSQPSVPVVNEEGEWIVGEKGRFLLKPGGHGALWKLLFDSGAMAWAKEKKKTIALVRQGNNVLAGLDGGLLSFVGVGWKGGYSFGFASCPRLLRAAEGMNVVRQMQGRRVVTNVEYCDFVQKGIAEVAEKEGSPYSSYSSNTNLLFVDLFALEEAVRKDPFPGLLINWKGEKGKRWGRLESTMQNIAEQFEEEKTFVTYNVRHKTIGTIKKPYIEGGSFLETPEKCLFDYLFALRELLEKDAACLVPPLPSLEEMQEKGPSFFFSYHPILGPLYSMVKEKFCQNTHHLLSCVRLEIAALLCRSCSIQGSLWIEAKDLEGSCILEGCQIENGGVDWEQSRPYWKGEFRTKEALSIVLQGKGRFIAKNVRFLGNHSFVIQDGEEVEVFQRGDLLAIERRPWIS